MKSVEAAHLLFFESPTYYFLNRLGAGGTHRKVGPPGVWRAHRCKRAVNPSWRHRIELNGASRSEGDTPSVCNLLTHPPVHPVDRRPADGQQRRPLMTTCLLCASACQQWLQHLPFDLRLAAVQFILRHQWIIWSGPALARLSDPTR